MRGPDALRSLLTHGLISLAATWPLAADPTRRLVGHPDVDVWNHAWGPWWFWQSLRSGQLPWRTDLISAPDGGVLWFIDPISGLVGAPLIPLLGATATWNLLIWAMIALVSAGAAALARRLTGPGPHVLIASASMVFGPYLLSELHNGISEIVNVGPALLAIAAADAAFTEGGRRRWAALAGWMSLTLLSSLYNVLAAGWVIAALAVPWVLRRPSPVEWRGAAAAAALPALLAGALWVVITASLESPDALIDRQSASLSSRMIFHNAVDPRTFLWPGGFQSIDLRSFGEEFLHSGYVGLLSLPLIALGLRRTRRWDLALAAAGLLVLSLGPYLFFDGRWVRVGERELPMPMHLLHLLLPSQGISHSLRLFAPGLAITAALAASAFAGTSRWRCVLGMALVITDMVVLGGAPWPVARTPALDDTIHRAIAAAPGEESSGIVLDLPGAVSNTMAPSRYFLLQTVHRRAIPYRPNARASTSDIADNPTLQLLALASEYRPQKRRDLKEAVHAISQIRREALTRAGVRWVVVHRELERGSERVALTEEILTALYGPPQVRGDHALYVVDGHGAVHLRREWRQRLAMVPQAQLDIRILQLEQYIRGTPLSEEELSKTRARLRKLRAR